jgi:hypothetical protein
MPAACCFGVATADRHCEAYNGHDDIRDVWERVRGLVARGRATEFWTRQTRGGLTRRSYLDRARPRFPAGGPM